MGRMMQLVFAAGRRVGPALVGLAVLGALLGGCGGGPAADLGFSSEPAAHHLEVAAADTVT